MGHQLQFFIVLSSWMILLSLFWRGPYVLYLSQGLFVKCALTYICLRVSLLSVPWLISVSGSLCQVVLDLYLSQGLFVKCALTYIFLRVSLSSCPWPISFSGSLCQVVLDLYLSQSLFVKCALTLTYICLRVPWTSFLFYLGAELKYQPYSVHSIERCPV
jgi:hypothetical protein